MAGHARVVAHHVHRPEPVNCSGRQRLHRRLVADIRGHRQPLAAPVTTATRPAVNSIAPPLTGRPSRYTGWLCLAPAPGFVLNTENRRAQPPSRSTPFHAFRQYESCIPAGRPTRQSQTGAHDAHQCSHSPVATGPMRIMSARATGDRYTNPINILICEECSSDRREQGSSVARRALSQGSSEAASSPPCQYGFGKRSGGPVRRVDLEVVGPEGVDQVGLQVRPTLADAAIYPAAFKAVDDPARTAVRWVRLHAQHDGGMPAFRASRQAAHSQAAGGHASPARSACLADGVTRLAWRGSCGGSGGSAGWRRRGVSWCLCG